MGSGGGGEGGGVPGRQQPVQLQPVSRMSSHVSRLRSWPHVMEFTSQTLPHSPGGDEGSGGDGGGGGEGGGDAFEQHPSQSQLRTSNTSQVSPAMLK